MPKAIGGPFPVLVGEGSKSDWQSWGACHCQLACFVILGLGKDRGRMQESPQCNLLLALLGVLGCRVGEGFQKVPCGMSGAGGEGGRISRVIIGGFCWP